MKKLNVENAKNSQIYCLCRDLNPIWPISLLSIRQQLLLYKEHEWASKMDSRKLKCRFTILFFNTWT